VGALSELGGVALPEGAPGTLVVGRVAALARVIGGAAVHGAAATHRTDVYAEGA
jgi:hypothetical protein